MNGHRRIIAILGGFALGLNIATGGESAGQSLLITTIVSDKAARFGATSKHEVAMADLQWGVPSEGLRLSASLDREKVEAGDPISLVLVLENISGQSIRVTSRSKWTDYRLTVSAPDGRRPESTSFGKHVADTADLTRRTDVELAPGAKLVSELMLNRLFDLSIANKYEVLADRDIYRLGGQGFAVVTSNKAVVIVHEQP